MRPLLFLAFAPACMSGPSITLDVNAQATERGNGAKDLAGIYSLEKSDHILDAMVTITEFPASFAMTVDGPGHGAFEASDGVDIAVCDLFFANAGTFGDADDGFGTDGSLRQAGYTLIYANDYPSSAKPFGIAGLDQGWNVLRRAEVTCDDAIDLGNGAIAWPAKYERLSLDATLHVVITGDLELQSWEPPLSCP